MLALVILYAGWKKWWVFGWQYRDLERDRNEWKNAALNGTLVARKAVDLAHDAHETTKERNGLS